MILKPSGCVLFAQSLEMNVEIMTTSSPENARVFLILGIVGLLPFWAPVALLIFPEASLAWSIMAQKAYAAAILAFLGAVHWGLAIADRSFATTWSAIWGVVPALAGWLALLMADTSGLIILGGALALSLLVDYLTLSGSPIARWYWRMRLPLSLGAIAAIFAMLLFAAHSRVQV